MDSIVPTRHKSLALPIAALILSLAIAAATVLVVFHPIYLTSSGSISTTTLTVYTTGVTILATILTAFIGSQIQLLLAWLFDRKLSQWDPNSPLSSLNTRWRAIVNIDSLKEKPRNIPIHVVYLLVALVTTAIVTSLTLYSTTRSVPYSQQLANGPSAHIGGTQGLCTEILPKASLKDPNWAYMWNLDPNGTVYLVQVAEGACPTRDAQMLLGNVNSLDTDAFAYADAGVAVHRSALGAPLSIYSPERWRAPELGRLLDTYGTSILTTTQCVRIVKQNPIHCQPAGKAVLKKPWFNITSQDGKCSNARKLSTAQWDQYNTEGSMLKQFCAHDEVGQATVVFGAHGGYAHWLAQSINDWKRAPPTKNTSTYAITCDIDARHVFDYQSASLNMRNGGNIQSRFSRTLNGTGKPCSGPTVDTAVVATAASAIWQLLLQNEGLDGWFDLVWQTTGDNRGPPYAFNDSKNALEDVLGLTAAMVSSRMNSTFMYEVPSTLVFSSVRIGDGKLASLAFLLPPVAAAVILVYLILATTRSPNVRIDSTDLVHLIKFGWRYGEQTSLGYSRGKVPSDGKGEQSGLLYQRTFNPGKVSLQRDSHGSWNFSMSFEDEG